MFQILYGGSQKKYSYKIVGLQASYDEKLI